MSWHWVLVTFFAGGLGGYMLCDVLQTENRITYVIKKLRAKDGGTIAVDSEAAMAIKDKKAERQARRDARKAKLNIN